MVCLLDGYTDSFGIVAVILQRDTLVPYLFIICVYYILRTSINLIKENDFTLKSASRKQYPAETITDADYADDRVLLANIQAQAESLQYSVAHVSGSVSLHINPNKTSTRVLNEENPSPLNVGSI